MSWRWLGVEVAVAIHERQLAEHGGAVGIRDSGALESALARPLNLAAYSDPDTALLAAAYIFGVARNHPFVDGNKRTAWVLGRLFLRTNGATMTFDKADAIRTVLAVAGGEMTEDALADWIRGGLSAP